MTIKRAIRTALDDVSKENFVRFCGELRDRPGEPRVVYRDVEGKGPGEITELLVSVFTEIKALDVTLDLLKTIRCNAEAERLHSETRAFLEADPTFLKTTNGDLNAKPSQEALSYVGKQQFQPPQAAGLKTPEEVEAEVKAPVLSEGSDPTFPKTADGDLNTKPSQEALSYAVKKPLQPSQAARAKTPEEVEAEAKACVLSEGGDPQNKRLVLSRCTMQCGKYKGQNYKWLLENDVGYVAFLMNQGKTRSKSYSMDLLIEYATAYPEVMGEVRFNQKYEESTRSGKKGEALVGFGHYKELTLKQLYDSKDKEIKSYVNFLREKETWNQESKMDIAKNYIKKRDKLRKKK